MINSMVNLHLKFNMNIYIYISLHGWSLKPHLGLLRQVRFYTFGQGTKRLQEDLENAQDLKSQLRRQGLVKIQIIWPSKLDQKLGWIFSTRLQHLASTWHSPYTLVYIDPLLTCHLASVPSILTLTYLGLEEWVYDYAENNDELTFVR